MRWTVPNILTALRLMAAPFVALAFIIFHSPVADVVAFVIFVAAALTDYVDGYLARLWKQESKFGRMLDPIADKVMVVIALALLIGAWQGQIVILIPAVIILFREMFVSGLREFLGTSAKELQVTRLAKWKTTIQMFAIGVLFLTGLYQDNLRAIKFNMDPVIYEQVLARTEADTFGLIKAHQLSSWFTVIGLILIWAAAVLTLLTGWDYFRKALPYLKDER
jgi:CDP-diacylglycerol--glycerol-3-phosphate 3-phosphatidyltransferase